ncbi:protein white-like [Littorina saxatilis]|uniref:ABC transporter domain-containing protein n=1 Tax=Littorina saxatilis TaxID=31220 RepID=A0AAN9BTL7_9CAEN
MAEDEASRQPLLRASHSPVDRTGYGAHSEIQQIPEDRINRASYDSFAPRPRTLFRSDSTMEQQPVTLSWENISVFVKEKKKKRAEQHMVEVDAENGKVSTKNGVKQIVRDVSGVVEPGSLLAIMGASGAGKSTLMNVLTNRNLKDCIVDGQVKVNGVSAENGIRNVSAYVQQDDLFFSTLTVRETLRFRALLRMDQTIPKKARLERVEEIIQEMGLLKCADTQVGKAGTKKGISGGESKRLSFACEMLTNPPLMFCDEPTSGLDSFMAQSIVQTLKNMASKNRTILCTIHQPSSEVFAMFDRVLLLAEGRVAFMGESARAVEFFRSLKYTCPNNFNPADFYILTLAIVPGQEEECRTKVNAICDAFDITDEANETRNHFAKEKSDSARTSGSVMMDEAFKTESRYEAGWGRQFSCVIWRSWISLMRDAILFRVRMIQTMVVALVLGLIYLRLDYDQKGVMNINGALFLLITNASFTNMFAVVNSFPHELAIFMREYGSGLYRTDVYFLAKGLAELPTFVILPVIFISIDYWMIGLTETWQAYLVATGIIVLVSNVAVSFGLIISTLAGDVNIALAIAPPILIPFMMFGGFFLNNDSVPVYFIWLKYLSWFKYANELLTVNQWEDVTSIDCGSNSTLVPCQYRNGADVLRYISFSADNNWLNLGLLFALLFGFRLFSFIFLLIRARRSKT